MADDNWWEAAPLVDDKWWEAAPEVDNRSVKSRLEALRRNEADQQYDQEGGLTHFARSVLSGATLGHEPEYMAAIRPGDAPKEETAMSERQRIERFKTEHPYASAAGNALGGLAGVASAGLLPEATGAVIGGANVLGQLGRAAAPYVAKGAGLAVKGGLMYGGAKAVDSVFGNGATNYLKGLAGY